MNNVSDNSVKNDKLFNGSFENDETGMEMYVLNYLACNSSWFMSLT